MASMTNQASANHALLISRLAWLIDYGERAMLFALYLLLVQALLPSLAHAPFNTLLLLSESIVIGFLLFRRQTSDVTHSPVDWLLAIAGTAAPLFMRAGGHPWAPPMLGALIMILGVLTHISAKLSLRRSFGMAAANRGVKIGGPYRLVRHPMYLGYAITWSGFLLLNPTWTNAGLCVFAGAMQAMRIVAEERLLKGDAAYRAYTEKTPFRMLPGVF